MKVLVTGREGQLASSLAERGRQHDWLELSFAGRPQLDLANPDSILSTVAQVEPEAIINAAAYTSVDQAEEKAELAFCVNADGAGAVARAAAAHRIPIIHISTDYVFDGSSPAPYWEDAPVAPINVYGRSKAEGERQVREAAADHLILRTSWVYSPFGQNFVRTMLRLARDRDELTVVADQVGNPTSALDLADGLIVMLESWRQGSNRGLGQTYHLAGTGEASWYDLAVEILRSAERSGLPAPHVRPIATKEWPTAARRPANSRLNCDRFHSDFGFRMPLWQDSLQQVVERLIRPESRDGSHLGHDRMPG